MKASRETAKLFKALVALQAELPLANRDRTNEFDHYSYATLASVRETCKPLLEKHRLAVFHTMTMAREDGREIILETMLVHESGEWVQSHLPIRPVPFPGQKDKTITPRNTGSALTYAERYSFMAIIGMAPNPDEDDDGGQGSGERRRQQAGDAKPNLTRDRLPAVTHPPARSGADGAGAARGTRPSGPEPAGGGRTAQEVADAFDERNPPPPMDAATQQAAAPTTKDSMAVGERCDHFAAFLEWVFSDADRAFEHAAECSSFVGDKGERVRVKSWQGLAKSSKWLHNTINNYNDRRGEDLPEYTKDWHPPPGADAGEEDGGPLPF